MAETINEDLKALQLFFYRPLESIYLPKGDDQVRFRIPASLQPADNKDPLEGSSKVKSRKEVAVLDVKKKPNISRAMKLCKDDCFTTYKTEHCEMAEELINCFMKAKNLKELISVCAYSRLRCNPYLFNYSLTAAVMERPDTQGLPIPTYVEMFPHLFLDGRSIALARQKVAEQAMRSELNDKEDSPEPVLITIKPTASDKLPEQHVAYFREDIGLNMFSYYWNNVYYYKHQNFIKYQDRVGEMFYYVHQQIIARYRNERICNKLKRVQPLENLHEPIPEAYFPKLYSGVNRAYASRPEDMVPTDIDRTDAKGNKEYITIKQLEEYRDSIVEAIVAGYAIKVDGSEIPLDEVTGIDVLGWMLRGKDNSPNWERYGKLTTDGFILLGALHDPKGLYLEEEGVISYISTNLRDPLFYRWMMFINEIFIIHKDQLKQYQNDELDFPGITVTSTKIKSSKPKDPTNQISTHWESNLINLEIGLDFNKKNTPVQAQVTYLQHEDFDYVIEVKNDTNEEQIGTVRIFMAPMKDEDEKLLGYNEQRRLMIELDKFSHTLTPGKNTIHRKSLDSSVTMPYENIFPKDMKKVCSLNNCHCGWPPYMLVPKGTTDGHPMELFVMVTNHNDDKVEEKEPKATKEFPGSTSYCGVHDKKYPDKRAMGFPFDRYNDACFLEDFLLPNMSTQKCTIVHTDEVVYVNKPPKQMQ